MQQPARPAPFRAWHLGSRPAGHSFRQSLRGLARRSSCHAVSGSCGGPTGLLAAAVYGSPLFALHLDNGTHYRWWAPAHCQQDGAPDAEIQPRFWSQAGSWVRVLPDSIRSIHLCLLADDQPAGDLHVGPAPAQQLPVCLSDLLPSARNALQLAHVRCYASLVPPGAGAFQSASALTAPVSRCC